MMWAMMTVLKLSGLREWTELSNYSLVYVFWKNSFKEILSNSWPGLSFDLECFKWEEIQRDLSLSILLLSINPYHARDAYNSWQDCWMKDQLQKFSCKFQQIAIDIHFLLRQFASDRDSVIQTSANRSDPGLTTLETRFLRADLNEDFKREDLRIWIQIDFYRWMHGDGVRRGTVSN